MKRILVTAMLLMAAAAAPARADLIFDTWSGHARQGDSFLSDEWALRFQPTQDYTLDSAEIYVRNSGGFVASVADDTGAGGTPGTTLASANGTAAAGIPTASVFYATPATLQAGHTYWLTLRRTSGPIAWENYNESGTSMCKESGIWVAKDVTLMAKGYGTVIPPRTPEPGTLVLVGAGLAMLARRRRR